MESGKLRKKPGRPRKRATNDPVNTYGIVDQPLNPDNCVEMVYNQPQILKCIVAIFKEYASDDIIIDFARDTITFSGRDHSMLVNINITICTRDMNMYYFAPPPSDSGIYRIVVRRDNLNIVTAIIEKTHYKVTFALNSDDLSTLIIILSNCEYDNDDRFDISVVPRAISLDETRMRAPESYPLEFTIDSHHFRRKISELKKIARDMIIQKTITPARTAAVQSDACDLEISFGTTPRVSYTGIYHAASKIKLRCDIPTTELFVATISIARIYPLMAVNLPGGMTFFVGREEPHVVRVGLDTRSDGHQAILAQFQIWTAQDQ
jgi:hypothetical protein